MSMSKFRGAVKGVLMVALVFGAGAAARADDEAQSDAKIVRIGPADPQTEAPHLPPPDGGHQVVEAPKYWIGLLGGPVTPDVRHHVQIPENQGLMIREVVPESPAAKAGIEQFDILLRANDTDLHEMTDLVDIVRTLGEQKSQITLEVLRHGSRDTVQVTPEERPAHVAQRHGGGEGMMGENGVDLQRFFGPNSPFAGQGFDFRHMGPGVIVGQGGGLGQIPNGVSINVQKEGDQPARITVKRGSESWEVIGDNPESLGQLPEELRPFVERMLHGGPADFNVEMPQFGRMPGRPGFDGERLQQRLEEMERRMQEMQERILGPNNGSGEKPAPPSGETK